MEHFSFPSHFCHFCQFTLNEKRFEFVTVSLYFVYRYLHAVSNTLNTSCLNIVVEYRSEEKDGQARLHDTLRYPYLHSQEFHQYGETLLFANCRADLDARLPVTGGEVLQGTGRGLERLRIRAGLQKTEVRLDDFRLPEQLHAPDRFGSRARRARRRRLLLHRLAVLLLLTAAETAQILA